MQDSVNINIEEKNVKESLIDYRKSFTPDDASKGLFLFLVLQVLMTIVYYIFSYLNLNTIVANILLNVIVDSTFVVAVFTVAKQSNRDFFASTGFKGKFKPMFILIALATSIVSLFAFSSVTNLFMEILYRIGYNSVTSSISIPNFGTYVLYIFLICVLPAICEEILFRGLIYSGLTKISRTVAIFGSAFLFMLVHGSPDQTVHQFILGVILALSFEATKTLWVPILIHFFNNFIAISMTYFFYSEASSEAAANSSVNTQLWTYVIYAILLAGVGFYVIMLFIKAFKKYADNPESNSLKVRDLSTGGTIESEILPVKESSGESKVESNEEVFRYKENLKPTHVTNQGRLFFILSISWMALEWILALISGFGYNVML